MILTYDFWPMNWPMKLTYDFYLWFWLIFIGNDILWQMIHRSAAHARNCNWPRKPRVGTEAEESMWKYSKHFRIVRKKHYRYIHAFTINQKKKNILTPRGYRVARARAGASVRAQLGTLFWRSRRLVGSNFSHAMLKIHVFMRAKNMLHNWLRKQYSSRNINMHAIVLLTYIYIHM